MPLLEAVPNVSEGRDDARLDPIVAALRGAAGVRLLDVSSDPDHHRSVLTAVGESEALEGGLLAMARTAVAQIDLRRHRGVHPRVGAVDVVPFVPLAGATMAAAVEAAHRFARRVGVQLEIPVFLYGEAASAAERRLPAALRRRGLPALASALAEGSLRPDYGPPSAHPTAGVMLVGARSLLVAWNVWLRTADVSVARAIARAVRERDGGLPGVQALGFYLESRRQAQVSLNLLRPAETALYEVIDRVRAEALARGVEIDRSELIGLVPESVALAAAAAALGLPRLAPGQLLSGELTGELSG